jgi:hypothetical protein
VLSFPQLLTSEKLNAVSMEKVNAIEVATVISCTPSMFPVISRSNFSRGCTPSLRAPRNINRRGRTAETTLTKTKTEMGLVRELWKELSAKSATKVVLTDLEIEIEATETTEEIEIVLREITIRSLDAREAALLASVQSVLTVKIDLAMTELSVATAKTSPLLGLMEESLITHLLQEAVKVVATEITTAIMTTVIIVKRATLTVKEEIIGIEIETIGTEGLVSLAVLSRSSNLPRISQPLKI